MLACVFCVVDPTMVLLCRGGENFLQQKTDYLLCKACRIKSRWGERFENLRPFLCPKVKVYLYSVWTLLRPSSNTIWQNQRGRFVGSFPDAGEEPLAKIKKEISGLVFNFELCWLNTSTGFQFFFCLCSYIHICFSILSFWKSSLSTTSYNRLYVSGQKLHLRWIVCHYKLQEKLAGDSEQYKVEKVTTIVQCSSLGFMQLSGKIVALCELCSMIIKAETEKRLHWQEERVLHKRPFMSLLCPVAVILRTQLPLQQYRSARQ